MGNDHCKTLKEHLESNLNSDEKKRILSLDGGGLKGLVTIGMLEKLESELASRAKEPENFRLSDHFDLIAGTSTGAIIAAALALGWKVEDVKEIYFELGNKVFKKRFWQGRFFGLINDKFSDKPLRKALEEAYGADTKLGGDDLKTGLLVVSKRIDSGSPWPLTNHPNGKYYEPDPARRRVGNKDYPLWKVVRASTAASTFFKPEKLVIFEGDSSSDPVVGDFIDGGLSPYNDPALQAVMVATIDGYGFDWKLSGDKLEVVSLGTGVVDTNVESSKFATGRAVRALVSLMNDSAELQKIILQWMSDCIAPTVIDSTILGLKNNLIGDRPSIKYLRYDADMTDKGIGRLSLSSSLRRSANQLESWDNPKNMDAYYQIGQQVGKESIKIADLI